jgi:hypothetical protein
MYRSKNKPLGSGRRKAMAGARLQSADVVLLIFAAACSGAAGGGRAMAETTLELATVRAAQGRVVPVVADADVSDVRLVREWKGPLCRTQVVNRGKKPVRLKEVVLFRVPLPLPGETGFYGEGAQMLSQTGGTLAKPVDLGHYTDRGHYKIPQPADVTTVYGMLTLTPPKADAVLMGFTSCRRFIGRFYVRPGSVEVVVDTEGLQLTPGAAWELEEFLFARGPGRSELLDGLAQRIAENHPRLRFEPVPAGWCSWYCFGPRVRDKQILANLDFIAKNIPALKYIQVDDGYQAAMGDWLETGKAFGGGPECAQENPGQGVRAGYLGRSLHCRARLAPFQGTSRLVHPGRGQQTAALQPGLVRRLAQPSLVRPGRHAPGSPETPGKGVPQDAPRLGLHLLQAGRKFLGHAARRPFA